MGNGEEKELLSGIVNFNEYFNAFDCEGENNRSRATGFTELDKEQIFKSGVYALGGRPGVGKTTFCWQLLEQLAENGERCIYGTYEQRAEEIYLKSLTRKLYSYEGNSAPIIVVTRIKNGSYDKEIELKSFSSEVINEADVVWGLQFYATKMLDNGENANNGEILHKLASEARREMTLKCLKNKYGNEYEVNFKYEAAHNYFQSVKGFSERSRV